MYRRSSKRDHSELTAKLVAAFVTFGCLCFFALFAAPERQASRKVSLAPVATPQPSLEPPPPPPRGAIDPIEKFRAVPGRWASVDFKHHTYSPYKFADGRQRPLILKNGEYKYDLEEFGRGWFSLNDVYYFDVTGDLIPEAIVDLLHVECGGGSCDGGSHLLLIYAINAEGKLKQRFEYETGSYAYGCGLKSITLGRKEINLEVFGDCPGPALTDVGPAKFMVKDRTRLTFRLFDNGFFQTTTELLKSDYTDVKTYRAELHINEESATVIRP